MSKTIVFAGPSLPTKPDPGWQDLLEGLEIRPPAQRGDVLSALCDEPDVLVLLDGYYYSVPAVTHKELLYALESGVRVIGAASMGALRAAELHPFGMEGIGRVFELYRDGVLDGDDEVAILHASEEFDFKPLTLALVDVRHAMSRLEARGVLEGKAGKKVIASLKELSFQERTQHRIREEACRFVGQEAAEELVSLLAEGGIKRADARRALAAAKAAPAKIPRTETLRLPEKPTATTFLGYFQEWHLRVPETGPTADAPTFLEAWNMLRIFHPQAEELVGGLRLRFLLASAARESRWEAPADRIRQILGALRGGILERFRRPLLPRLELLAEAEDQALAETASQRPEGPARLLADLSQSLGLSRDRGVEKLYELLGVQDDLIPAWSLARAGACCAAFPQAVSLARSTKEVYQAFRTWAKGARISDQDLMDLASGLWGCPVEEVPARAAARGLHNSRGFSPGFREALEFVAAAERLPNPINSYTEDRERIREVPLAYPLELPSLRALALAR